MPQLRLPGTQPLPTAWRKEPPHVITESLAAFTARKMQCDDLFELPRSQTDWEILWLHNELASAGELHRGPHLDKQQRLANAQKIWDLGRRYCWQNHECSFAIYAALLNFVGLEIHSPPPLCAS